MRPRSETWRDQRERRYLIGPERVAELLALLSERLPVVSYAPGSTRTFVVTTYLDSSEREYLSIAENSAGHLSLKVRVREYMPLTEANGQPERLSSGTTCFLERKERVGELRVKQRVELAKDDVAGVLRREAQLSGDRTVVSALRAELDARDLEPVLVSRYIRRVFGSDRSLRVTFDEKLGFHAPPGRSVRDGQRADAGRAGRADRPRPRPTSSSSRSPAPSTPPTGCSRCSTISSRRICSPSSATACAACPNGGRPGRAR